MPASIFALAFTVFTAIFSVFAATYSVVRLSSRLCERSEAIHAETGLLRCARKDGKVVERRNRLETEKPTAKKASPDIHPWD